MAFDLRTPDEVANELAARLRQRRLDRGGTQAETAWSLCDGENAESLRERHPLRRCDLDGLGAPQQPSGGCVPHPC